MPSDFKFQAQNPIRLTNSTNHFKIEQPISMLLLYWRTLDRPFIRDLITRYWFDNYKHPNVDTGSLSHYIQLKAWVKKTNDTNPSIRLETTRFERIGLSRISTIINFELNNSNFSHKKTVEKKSSSRARSCSLPTPTCPHSFVISSVCRPNIGARRLETWRNNNHY